MEVIYFQLIIITTIVASRFFSKKLYLWVSLAWTGWTLIIVFTLPLAVIQLLVVWVTAYVVWKLTDQKSKITNLEAYISDMDLLPKSKDVILQLPVDRLRPIEGREHLAFMLEQIGKANKVVVILSGWISDNVVDDKFINLLKCKLGEGCHVYLGFGFEDYQGHHKSWKSKRALRKIDKLKQDHRESLHLGKFATHEKMFIVDDLLVIGSNNWLSNSSFRNSERSLAIDDAQLAHDEGARAAKLITQNELNSSHSA